MSKHRNIFLFRAAMMVVILMMVSGCATMKHFRTSRTVTLEKAPYIHGKLKKATVHKIAHIPVTVDNSQHHLKDKAPWDAIAKDVSQWMTDQKWSIPIDAILMKELESPEIYVGDKEYGDFSTILTDDDEDQDSYMVLHTTNPSYKWRNKIRARCKAAGTTHVLHIQIGRSEYRIRQKDWKGRKELILGTGYRVPVKWLTSLDDPIEVVHFTGALMDSSGHILRAGAEGILAAKSASILESAIGIGKGVSNKKMKKLTTSVRRKDLPGKPLSYQVALQNLVANLLKKKDMIIK
ncbi:hypothetical protein KAR48_15735 [bacterium]|nr:hypothetical protein [bacterium]